MAFTFSCRKTVLLPLMLDVCVKFFASLFCAVNPIIIIPVFALLTKGFSGRKKNIIIGKSCLLAFVILTFFALFGKYFFAILGVDLGALRIAGGLLLLILALQMAYGDPHTIQHMETQHRGSTVSIITPFIASPGSITTITFHSCQAKNMMDFVVILCTLSSLIILCAVFLYKAEILFKSFLTKGMTSLTRIFGIILTAVAVDFFLEGIKLFSETFFIN